MSERQKILEMLAEKKINSEEAMKLLEALNKPDSKKGMRYLKIQVFESDREKPNVNISIPIMLVKLGAKFIPKDKLMNAEVNGSSFDLSSLDWDELFSLASKGEIGDIFNADIDEDDGKTTRIRIFIE